MKKEVNIVSPVRCKWEPAKWIPHRLKPMGNPFWAYEMSVENNNDYLNFNDAIWTDDIAPIVEACRKHKIREFTISNTCSGLTQTLTDFEEHGCKVVGLTKANTGYKDETVPAIKLQVL